MSTPDRDKLDLGPYNFLTELFRMKKSQLQNTKWFVRELSIDKQKMLQNNLASSRKIYEQTIEKFHDKLSEINDKDPTNDVLKKQYMQGANRNLKNKFEKLFENEENFSLMKKWQREYIKQLEEETELHTSLFSPNTSNVSKNTNKPNSFGKNSFEKNQFRKDLKKISKSNTEVVNVRPPKINTLIIDNSINDANSSSPNSQNNSSTNSPIRSPIGSPIRSPIGSPIGTSIEVVSPIGSPTCEPIEVISPDKPTVVPNYRTTVLSPIGYSVISPIYFGSNFNSPVSPLKSETNDENKKAVIECSSKQALQIMESMVKTGVNMSNFVIKIK